MGSNWLEKEKDPNPNGLVTEKSIPNTDTPWIGKDADAEGDGDKVISTPVNDFSREVVEQIMKKTKLSQRKVMRYLLRRATQNAAELMEKGEPVYKVL